MGERLQELLFEFSSSERMAIMLELRRRRLKLSQVSREVGLTTPEASRHLQRLSKAGLIHKDADGHYGLSSFGELALSQLSGLGFIAKYREYFLEHSVSCLPYEFIDRIGELDAGFIPETFRSLEEAESMFQQARERVWILSDQILRSSIPILTEKIKAPFNVRIILPEAVMPPNSEAMLPSTLPWIQKRVLPRVDMAIVITEGYAAFSLPNLGGRIDYEVFSGSEPKLRKWCEDLFLYYWERAKPLVSG